ncbi:MAG: dolichyl-phosphate beta-glucosyltransferase [bacterium]
MVRYSVIIPAYNEERTIERALFETRDAFRGFNEPFEIIVVDDGSRDGTIKVVESLRESVPESVLIKHEQNQGKGAAVRTGVAASRGEYFVFLDADLATHPKEFSKCIPLFATHDIVIGSRQMPGSLIVESQPAHRVLAGRLFNQAIRNYLKIPLIDTQCGFKAFRASVAKSLFADMSTTGWVFDVELLGRALKSGLKVAEIPVSWKNGAESRVKFGDAWRIIQELRAVKQRLN